MNRPAEEKDAEEFDELNVVADADADGGRVEGGISRESRPVVAPGPRVSNNPPRPGEGSSVSKNIALPGAGIGTPPPPYTDTFETPDPDPEPINESADKDESDDENEPKDVLASL